MRKACLIISWMLCSTCSMLTFFFFRMITSPTRSVILKEPNRIILAGEFVAAITLVVLSAVTFLRIKNGELERIGQSVCPSKKG